MSSTAPRLSALRLPTILYLLLLVGGRICMAVRVPTIWRGQRVPIYAALNVLLILGLVAILYLLGRLLLVPLCVCLAGLYVGAGGTRLLLESLH